MLIVVVVGWANRDSEVLLLWASQWASRHYPAIYQSQLRIQGAGDYAQK